MAQEEAAVQRAPPGDPPRRSCACSACVTSRRRSMLWKGTRGARRAFTPAGNVAGRRASAWRATATAAAARASCRRRPAAPCAGPATRAGTGPGTACSRRSRASKPGSRDSGCKVCARTRPSPGQTPAAQGFDRKKRGVVACGAGPGSDLQVDPGPVRTARTPPLPRYIGSYPPEFLRRPASCLCKKAKLRPCLTGPAGRRTLRRPSAVGRRRPCPRFR